MKREFFVDKITPCYILRSMIIIIRNITDLTSQVGRCEGCWKARAVCSPRLHTNRLEELQRGCNVRHLHTNRLEERVGQQSINHCGYGEDSSSKRPTYTH